MNDVSRILEKIHRGDDHESEQLLPLIYAELRRLAAQMLLREKAGQTLQPTALVHEANLRLVAQEQAQYWSSRRHFFASAAEASIFDVSTGKPWRFLASGNNDWFYTVDWSKDGKYIAAGTSAGIVYIWEFKTGKIIHQWNEQPGPVFMVQFARDGSRLYYSDIRNDVCGRNLSDGKLIVRRRFNDPFIRFALSRDQSWMAVGGRPEVRLCDLSNRIGSRAMFELPGHARPIRGMAFLPDNYHIVTVSLDGTLRVWKLPPR